MQAGTDSWGLLQAASLEAERDYSAGEHVAMDYGAGKLDSQVLLDHGVVDLDSPQARVRCLRVTLTLTPRLIAKAIHSSGF